MNNEIVKKIEAKGYKVKFGNSTTVIEIFKSTIDGELFENEIAFSSKENNIDFLKEIYEDLKPTN